MKKYYDMYCDSSSGAGASIEDINLDSITNPSIGGLYQNVLNNYMCGLICWAIEDYTPYIQKNNLLKHFNKQRPSIFSKFWWHKSYNTKSCIWWKSHLGGDEQRKLFLAYLAKKYKNKYFK
jgi:hypothetical protein